ncbi:ABC transporter substrate-binding protein [Mycolicibacterium sp. S2-37]|uniref:ABC transporter substrate-binding protein n=1 Tax=Mycolicibacterium sp. S2-37 TaxID=2810297 RepID=UPI001A94E7DE|nr:ABC transporter substrate-binding protein [Mycolicibacterium sp. S2-37]MBO0680842.1 ABC transporter substrate-binding protein [Mycolicibacterium sp. S2-37]
MIRFIHAGPLLAVAVLVAGCSGGGATPAEPSATPDRAAALGELPPVTADFSWPPAETPPGHYPVTVSSCGEPVTFEKAPERAVVNDDNMIELLFALGLTDRMAGYAGAGERLRLTAFTDDYAAVPSLGPDYFSLEPLLGTDPDFVFAGWNYGFDSAGVNPHSLAELGIPSYALSESCRRIDDTLAPATIEEWFGDVRGIADIFGVPERAEALIAMWQSRLDRVGQRVPVDATPVRTFCWDWGTDTLGTGAGLTIVPELYRRAGAVNVFADLEEMWEDVSFEAVVERAPEMIAVTDYGDGPTGQQRIDGLKAMGGLDTVPAIRHDRFIVLPQEAVNPGIRIVDGIEALAAALYPNEFADLVGTPGFGLAPTAN